MERHLTTGRACPSPAIPQKRRFRGMSNARQGMLADEATSAADPGHVHAGKTPRSAEETDVSNEIALCPSLQRPCPARDMRPNELDMAASLGTRCEGR